jgi:hypothetical protein
MIAILGDAIVLPLLDIEGLNAFAVLARPIGHAVMYLHIATAGPDQSGPAELNLAQAAARMLRDLIGRVPSRDPLAWVPRYINPAVAMRGHSSI